MCVTWLEMLGLRKDLSSIKRTTLILFGKAENRLDFLELRIVK